MLLNKANLKDHTAKRTKVVEFDGFEVKLQQMGIKQQLEIERINEKKESMGELVYPMLINCCVDEKNQPFLDQDSVCEIPTDLAMKLFNACLELNRLDENDLDERAKNS